MHSARPDWGHAILAWERDGKRGYQFEDGELRIIKNGYYRLLEPVDRPVDAAQSLILELGKKIGRRKAAKRLGSTEPMISFDQQIEYFLDSYPKGFRGAVWAKKHRGLDAKKALKRHRNPVTTMARRLFLLERLRAKLEAKEAVDVVRDMLEVFDATDMVTKAQVRGLDRVGEENAGRLVKALMDLFEADDDYGRAFDRWVGVLARVLGKKPTWALATALPALVMPGRHVCVKKTTFARQAAWMAPNMTIDKAPRGETYLRIIDMAVAMRARLAKAGLEARDFLDVYDFVQLTLRPKAMKEIRDRARQEDTGAGAVSSDAPQEARLG